MNEIQNEQEEPLSFDDLKSILGPDQKICQFIYYDDLVNYNIDKLFAKPTCIILMDIHNGNKVESVGHFIALLKYKEYIEHFDPYGLNIEEELAITHEKDLLKQLLNNSGFTIRTNTTQLQQLKNDVQTCGRWCVARVRLHELNLRSFINFFKQSVTTGDQKVTWLTYFRCE